MNKYEYKIDGTIYELSEEEHNVVFNHIAKNNPNLIILRAGQLAFKPASVKRWQVSSEREIPDNLALDTSYPDLTKTEIYQKRRKEFYDKMGWTKPSEDELAIKKNEAWQLGLELSKNDSKV